MHTTRRSSFWLPAAASLTMAMLLGCGGQSPAASPYRVGLNRSSKSFRNERGEFEGLYVDVFRTAAARTRLPYRFVWLGDRSLDEAFARNEIDLHPAVADTLPRRRGQMYLTEPWWESPLIVVVPKESPIRAFDELRGKTVAVRPAAAGFWDMVFGPAMPGGARMLTLPAPVEALCAGQVSAVLAVGPDAEALLADPPAVCGQTRFRFLSRAASKVRYALTSRRELREVCDRLQNEILAMAADGTLAQVTSPWLGLTSSTADTLARAVESRRRLQRSFSLAGTLGVLLLCASLGALLWSERRARRRVALALDRARESEEAKSRFVATMSHEIRNPLNGILGMTEIMLMSPLDPGQRDAALTIQRSSEALLTVVNDVLDLAASDAGAVRLAPARFELRALLDDIGALMTARTAEKGIAFYVDVAADVPEVIEADSGRLRQVLLNLAGNAVKFTDAGSVRIRVVRAGASIGGLQLRFSVEDTGLGIAAADLPALFQRFRQLDSRSSRKYGGTGLGLVIAKTLVEAMGGAIEVRSEPGRGTCFEFALSVRVLGESPAPLAGRRVRLMGSDPELVRCLRQFAASAGAVIAEDGPAHVDLWVTPGEDRASEATAPPPAANVLRGVVSFHALVQALAADVPAVDRPQAPVLRSRLRGKRVLVAEDNAVNRKLLAALLEKLGCEVSLATDGSQAVEQWREKRPDAVLMDCQMPTLDGFEATRVIRSEELKAGTHRTPIWAVTANVLPDDRIRCAECGMDGMLAKPFTLAQLESTLAQMVEPDPAPLTGQSNHR